MASAVSVYEAEASKAGKRARADARAKAEPHRTLADTIFRTVLNRCGVHCVLWPCRLMCRAAVRLTCVRPRYTPRGRCSGVQMPGRPAMLAEYGWLLLDYSLARGGGPPAAGVRHEMVAKGEPP